MSISLRASLISALICTGWLVQSRALAADETDPAQKVVIDASLSEDGKTLDGVISIRIVNDTGAAIDTIPLWLYPNRFEEVSDALDDRLVRWIYPAGESRGGLEISGPRWNGVDLPADSVVTEGLPGSGIQSNRVIARVRLGTSLAPREAGVLDLRFHLTVPERRGRFGRFGGVVSLGGGWFPRPMADLTGRDTSLPSDVIEADVKVALPEGMGAVIHDVVFPWEANARAIEAQGLKTEELVLVAMDKMEVDERIFDWGKVVHVHRALNKRTLGWKETRGDQGALPGGLKDAGTFGVSGRVFEVVGNTERLIREVAPGCKLVDRVVLVSIPAWDHLVQLGPGLDDRQDAPGAGHPVLDHVEGEKGNEGHEAEGAEQADEADHRAAGDEPLPLQPQRVEQPGAPEHGEDQQRPVARLDDALLHEVVPEQARRAGELPQLVALLHAGLDGDDAGHRLLQAGGHLSVLVLLGQADRFQAVVVLPDREEQRHREEGRGQEQAGVDGGDHDHRYQVGQDRVQDQHDPG